MSDSCSSAGRISMSGVPLLLLLLLLLPQAAPAPERGECYSQSLQ